MLSLEREGTGCVFHGICTFVLVNFIYPEIRSLWTSLVVQWLTLCASTAGGTGSIPDQGRSACRTVWPKKTPGKQKSEV